MNKREKITWKSIWGMFYPILIYEAIGYVIPTLVISVLSFYVGANVTSDPKGIETIVMDMYMGNVLEIMILTSLIAIPIYAFIMYIDKRKYYRMRDEIIYCVYENVNVFKYLLIVPLSIASMFAFNMITSLVFLYLPDFMMDSYSNVEEILNSSSFTVQIISTGILAPIVEELIFRGVIYTRMKRVVNIPIAVVFSSLYFGIYHGNYVQGMYAFLVGVMMAFVYEKYKNIVAPIIFHMVANIFAVIVSFIGKNIETGEVVTQSTRELTLMYLESIPPFLFAVVLFTFIIYNVVKPNIKEY